MYLYQQQVQHGNNKIFNIYFFAGIKTGLYSLANILLRIKANINIRSSKYGKNKNNN